MKYLDLFSGYGGFSLGIHKAYENISKTSGTQQRGSKKDSTNTNKQRLATKQPTCIGFSEIDKYASQVLKYNYPNTKNYGDIQKINAAELPDFDLITGGFPCQAFSIAGKRKGFDDTRGTLFFDIARIIKEKRPKYLLLENVKGLLSHDDGRTFKTIISTLDELGYDVEWQVLNAKNFGVPQNRERVFIIGHLRGQSRPKVFPIGGTDINNTKKIEVVGELNSDTWQKRNESIRRVYSPDGLAPTTPTGTGGGVMTKIISQKERRTKAKLSDTCNTLTARFRGQPDGDGRPAVAVLTPDRLKKRQNGRRIKTDGEPMFTLTGQDKHGIYDGIAIRRLTPTECERLMGLEDGWTKYGVDTYHQVCYNKENETICKESVISKPVISQSQTNKLKSVTNTICENLKINKEKQKDRLLIKQESVELKIVKESNKQLSISVLCTIKDGEDMEQLRRLKELITQIKDVNFVIKNSENREHLECATNITRCGNSMGTQSMWKEGVLNQQEGMGIIDSKVVNTFIERLSKESLEENSPQKKLFIMLTWINLIMSQAICLSVPRKNTALSINSSINLQGNLLELKLLSLKTENIVSISDSGRYKMAGNGVVVNCVEEIIKRLLL